MDKTKSLYLCFFGDSELWDNVILTTAYPSGFSYPRPFRYRDKWIQAGLLDELRDQVTREQLVGKEATLAMRFRSDEHKWLLLPIRRVSLTCVNYTANQQSVYFKMGPMLDFGTRANLRQVCMEMLPEERESVVDPTLLFRSALEVPSGSFASAEREDEAWVAYCDLVSRDTGVPINEQARRSLFLRFAAPTNASPAKIDVIHSSKQMGSLYGSHLDEGKHYELVLFHRVPALLGLDTTIGKATVAYESPTGNLEVSRAEEDFTGNYDNHVLSVTAIRESGTWEEILVKPKADAVKADDGETVINLVKLSIPLRVDYSLWHRLRTTYVWFLLFWFALASDVLLDGLAESGVLPPMARPYLPYAKAVASAMAAVLLLVVKQRPF